MAGEFVLNEFVYLIFFAIVAEIIFNRFRIPSVIGMLLCGLLIGPHGFGLVAEDSIRLFAELGAVLLFPTGSIPRCLQRRGILILSS